MTSEIPESLAVLAADALYAAAAARWMPLGACQGEDPELFFPAGSLGPRSQVDAAKQVCIRCPVRGECLAYALATGQPDGIWGGTTWEERRGAHVLSRRRRELPAERIRGVHDPILRRVQPLIGRGQHAGAFRSDLPRQWLITTAFSLMHAAAEDAAARVKVDDAARLITATLVAAYTPARGRAHGMNDATRPDEERGIYRGRHRRPRSTRHCS